MFALEKEMRRPLKKGLVELTPPDVDELLGSYEHVRFLHEAPVGRVIPDILIWMGNVEEWEMLKRLRRLTLHECWILSGLIPEELDIDTLANRAWCSVNDIEPIVSKLHRQGWVERVHDETWRTNASLRTPMGSVIAIELKLADWRRALQQAITYSLFADHNWVVLDQSRITTTAEIAAEFEKAGVGLLTLARSSIKYVQKSKQQQYLHTERLLALRNISRRLQT